MSKCPWRYFLLIRNLQQAALAKPPGIKFHAMRMTWDLSGCCHENFIRRHRQRGRGFRMRREPRRGVMGIVLTVVNGRIEECRDGTHRRSYGSNIADAHTDGDGDGGVVAAVTTDGRIEEYRDGICQRSYGSNAQKVRVSGSTMAVTLRDGRVAEFENGSCRRMY